MVIRESHFCTAVLRTSDEGVTNVSPQGVRAHPALVEARQQRVTLAKLVASLRIPVEEEEGASRTPQKRSGVRALSAVR